MAQITLTDLTFTYPDGTRALDGVSLTVPDGSLTLLVGASGSGKSTLLRLLKPAIAPAGQMTGTVACPLRDDPVTAAAGIAFVAQDPDFSVVTDRVDRELAFGAENSGTDPRRIRRQVAETASRFGMEGWFHQTTDSLSGGQKQQLNLAAALVTRPRLLLLDEPTAQLDPLAAEELRNTVVRLNREWGLTVILAEHRLEGWAADADQTVVLDRGKVAFAGDARAAAAYLTDTPLLPALPAATQVWAAFSHGAPAGEIAPECPPLTVREGRGFLSRALQTGTAATVCPPNAGQTADPADSADTPVALAADRVWFRYTRAGRDILHDWSLTVRAGEICALLGGNGAGKTTALRLLAGLERPYKGTVRHTGRVAWLPQDPLAVFTADTVREVLAGALADAASSVSADEYAARHGIAPFLDRHPLDLSGGERQRCALAVILAADPAVLLLDEPTKGLDAAAKAAVSAVLRALAAAGTAILLVTHDTAFAARTADRCTLLFDGNTVGDEPPTAFFADNRFYTTETARLTYGLLDGAVLPEQIRVR